MEKSLWKTLTHPSPPSPKALGEGGSQTPLAHSTREGQGVRAGGNLTPHPPSPQAERGVKKATVPPRRLRRGGKGVRFTPLAHSVGEGQGVRASNKTR